MALWSNAEPDWDSDYDSTWEDDKDYRELTKDKPKRLRQHNLWKQSWNRAAEDLQRYRHGYPEPMPNLLFYQNKIPFEPNGSHIEYIHREWKEDYYTLEINHSYIQWLFPLREPGMNHCATPLTPAELQLMKNDDEVKKRLLESYKLMLGFYGIHLLDENTGKVVRAENWEQRFYNLNYNIHNNLRITRILKCLGEMGYQHYQAPLVRFFLEETLCCDNLQNVKRSVLDYFMFTVRDKKERKELVLFAWENYWPKRGFIWGPVKVLRKLKPQTSYSSEDNGSGAKEPGGKNKDDNDVKEPGGKNRDGNDVKEPGGKNKDDNGVKEPGGKNKDDNDVKEPGGKNKDDNDVKKPGGKNKDDNDVKEPGGKNKDNNDVKEPGGKNKDDNNVKEPGREKADNDVNMNEAGAEDNENGKKPGRKADEEEKKNDTGEQNQSRDDSINTLNLVHVKGSENKISGAEDSQQRGPDGQLLPFISEKPEQKQKEDRKEKGREDIGVDVADIPRKEGDKDQSKDSKNKPGVEISGAKEDIISENIDPGKVYKQENGETNSVHMEGFQGNTELENNSIVAKDNHKDNASEPGEGGRHTENTKEQDKDLKGYTDSVSKHKNSEDVSKPMVDLPAQKNKAEVDGDQVPQTEHTSLIVMGLEGALYDNDGPSKKESPQVTTITPGDTNQAMDHGREENKINESLQIRNVTTVEGLKLEACCEDKDGSGAAAENLAQNMGGAKTESKTSDSVKGKGRKGNALREDKGTIGRGGAENRGVNTTGSKKKKNKSKKD